MANEMQVTSNSTNHSTAHSKPFVNLKVELLIRVVE